MYKIFLAGMILFLAMPLYAQKATHEVMLCNSGKKFDCSDCGTGKKSNQTMAFLVDKKQSRVMNMEYLNGDFQKSFLNENCSIFDDKNWVCKYGNDNKYYSYKMHNSYLEFLFKDTKNYSDVVRICGKPL